jgi:hypothetical protein
LEDEINFDSWMLASHPTESVERAVVCVCEHRLATTLRAVHPPKPE